MNKKRYLIKHFNPIDHLMGNTTAKITDLNTYINQITLDDPLPSF